eukprot:9257309-Alexandrium_andersonii.AAC.1
MALAWRSTALRRLISCCSSRTHCDQSARWRRETRAVWRASRSSACQAIRSATLSWMGNRTGVGGESESGGEA